MKTSNLAIVFTDIKGFTERTSRQTLEENQRLLQTHHQLLAPLFKAFGGRIIKSIGDAFLVTFESPTQAVLSGIAIQDRLWQHNRQTPEAEQLHVRVAINVGEVRLESNDIFGEPVNIAARVEGIAEAGEVYFTEAVYLAMNKAEVPSQEVGAFELKGIPGKIRVFRVPRAPYRVEAPVAADSAAPAPQPVPQEAQPPFGNLALGRVSPSALTPGVDLATLGQHAAQLGTQARGLGQRLAHGGGGLLDGLAQRLSRTGLRVDGRMLGVGLGLLVLLVGGAVVLMRDSTQSAIDKVAQADAKERGPLLEEVRKRIAQEKDVGRREYLGGRLQEALGAWSRAASDYKSAFKAGEDDGEERLLELLEHEECAARVAAADALADLKLKGARGALEDLAEDGGKDDGKASGLFGLGSCDSKAAAKAALRRLGKD